MSAKPGIAARALRYCLDADYREAVHLRLFHAGDIHQTTAWTGPNRYPAIFEACRGFFGSRTDLRLLSFGCATGEEVLTLREYFPSANIVGAEINRRSLARCRRLPADDRIRFVYSDPRLIAPHGPFDAIFCLAVLQRTPLGVDAQGIMNLTPIYAFEKFERALVQLDAVLAPGGLFVVHHAAYAFRDTCLAAAYEPLAGAPAGRAVSRFLKDGSRPPEPYRSPTIYVKRPE